MELRCDFFGSICFTIFACLKSVTSDSICGPSSIYCSDDCCGDSCCDHDDEFTTAEIVGFVIGGLIGIASLICCIVCIYMMVKNTMKDRHAVRPYHNSNTVYVNSVPYNHPRPGPPPSYGQYNTYPSRAPNPYYNDYNDPVYPPGLVQGAGSSEPSLPPPYSEATRNTNT